MWGTQQCFSFFIEADCWMSEQCWMSMTPNNIKLEVKTLFSFISCHPTILVYKLKYWIHFRCCHPAISPSNNLPLGVGSTTFGWCLGWCKLYWVPPRKWAYVCIFLFRICKHCLMFKGHPVREWQEWAINCNDLSSHIIQMWQWMLWLRWW